MPAVGNDGVPLSSRVRIRVASPGTVSITPYFLRWAATGGSHELFGLTLTGTRVALQVAAASESSDAPRRPTSAGAVPGERQVDDGLHCNATVGPRPWWFRSLRLARLMRLHVRDAECCAAVPVPHDAGRRVSACASMTVRGGNIAA